jgi:hypothetical protein
MNMRMCELPRVFSRAMDLPLDLVESHIAALRGTGMMGAGDTTVRGADAANLLIALMGADFPAAAPDAVKRLSALPLLEFEEHQLGGVATRVTRAYGLADAGQIRDFAFAELPRTLGGFLAAVFGGDLIPPGNRIEDTRFGLCGGTVPELAVFEWPLADDFTRLVSLIFTPECSVEMASPGSRPSMSRRPARSCVGRLVCAIHARKEAA